MTFNTTNIAQDLADRDAFAQDFIKAAKQNGIQYSLNYDKDKFAIAVGVSLGHLTQNLSNAYVEYHAAHGNARKRVLINYVLGLRDALNAQEWQNAPFSEARKSLRPLVRSKIITDNERYTRMGDDPSQFKPTPRKSFSSDANILLAYDKGRTILQVTQTMLDSWGVSFSEALDIAMKNLRAVSRPRFKEIQRGLFTGEWNDYYDDSRLLLPELFAKHRHFDDPVIMIPTTGRIFIANKTDRRAQLDMLHFVRKEIEASMKIVSTQMYHFVDGKPTEYEPGDDKVDSKLFGIRLPIQQSFARQQHRIIVEYLAKTRANVHASPCQLMVTKDDNRLATLSMWMESQETMLPEADFVMLAKMKRPGGVYRGENRPMPWDEAMAKYGHLVQKIEGFPTLYRAAPISGDDTVMAEAA